MNSFILGLTWLLFVVCFVLSLYFIYHLFQKSIYEPYISKEIEYNYEDVSGSINNIIVDISGMVNDISNNLEVIQDKFDNYS